MSDFNIYRCLTIALLVVVLGSFGFAWIERTCMDATNRATDGPIVAEESVRLAGSPPAPLARRFMLLFSALRHVESAGNDRAVGDGGRSRGPYQCGRAAWADGGGDPDQYDMLVWDRAATERVMVGYWHRYGAVTDEQKARTWNGGPNGMSKPATLGYWRRVQKALNPGL